MTEPDAFERLGDVAARVTRAAVVADEDVLVVIPGQFGAGLVVTTRQVLLVSRVIGTEAQVQTWSRERVRRIKYSGIVGFGSVTLEVREPRDDLELHDATYSLQVDRTSAAKELVASLDAPRPLSASVAQGTSPGNASQHDTGAGGDRPVTGGTTTASTAPQSGSANLVLGCLVLALLAGGVVWGVAHLWPSGGGGGGGESVDWDDVVAEIQAQYPDVYGGRFEDGLLLVYVKGEWTELGATRLACETVKPILERRGVGGQTFAIYLPSGEVIATGSRCP